MTDYAYADSSGDHLFIDRGIRLKAYGPDGSVSIDLPPDAAERVVMAEAILQGTGTTVTITGSANRAARMRLAWTSARRRAAEWRREAESRPTSTVHECCERAQQHRDRLTDIEGAIGSVRDRLDEMERRATESVRSLRERVVELETAEEPPPTPCPVCGRVPQDQEYGPTGTCRHTTATRVHRTDGLAEESADGRPTGPERVQAAIDRDRGGDHAPAERFVCDRRTGGDA